MPTYEFRCNQCDNQFEELVLRIGGTAPCPACSSDDVSRLMSSFSARTKSESGGYRSVSSDACGSCSAGSCSGCSK